MARKPTYDRDDVLEKALNLFWARGYHATSLKDLEAALDMRPGSIYAAFGSKEQLFDEALRLYAKTSHGQLRENLSSSNGAIPGLANHIRFIGNTDPAVVPSRACMLVKTVLETPDDDPVLRQTAEFLMRQVEEEFTAILTTAIKNGELPETAEPARLASWIQSQIFGLRAYAQRSDSKERVSSLAEDIAISIERLGETVAA